MSKKLWNPSPEVVSSSNIKKYIQYVNDTYSLSLVSYADLYAWSIANLEEFWETFWNFSKIINSKKYSKVVEDLNVFPGTNWFPEAKLNFAENLLRYNDKRIALKFRGESRVEYDGHSLTYQNLNLQVRQISVSLRGMGIKSGDRVVAYMPNILETVIAMLACSSIGAVWASCGSELGSSAVIDRLGQIKPKVMFTVDGYFYKGKSFNILQNVIKINESISSIEKVVVFPFVDKKPTLSNLDNGVVWEEFIAKDEDLKFKFEQLPFDHPLFIMFSSGTTGKPKAMVQSAGGVLINHLKELVLHTDLKRSDTICYITSPSWMMWNWLVSSLAIGAMVLLFNGNPNYPNWEYIWNIIDEERITIFGTSASYIYYLMKEDLKPKSEFNLDSLKQISQTASPLSAEGFEFVYSSIKSDLHFNSIAGGTDINGCFAAGSPISPVYAGQIQSAALGMKIKAYNENGDSVTDIQGELVCEMPSPSMPLYFWNDNSFEKYKSAYFGNYKHIRNVWRHGDYIVIDSKTGGVTFHGRSDAILKPSGVRIGTSEIYNIIELLPEIEDSVAIGQNWEGDQRIVLFVKLRSNFELSDDLKGKIKSILKEKASPRHVPALIVETKSIPYTFSNKKVEIAISHLAHGRKVTNRGALANPESLVFYEHYFKK